MPPKRSLVGCVHRLNGGLVGDVGVLRERLAFARGDRLLGSGEIDVGDADAGAFSREHLRGLASHPAAGAGDHRDLPVEPSHDDKDSTRRIRRSTA